MKTQAVRKQELPKSQDGQNAPYQIDSLEKEINKKLLAGPDSSANRFLFSPCVQLLNAQTLKLDGVETGFFLSNISQQLRRKNANVPEIYFSLLYAAGLSRTLVLNQNANVKQRKSWVLFKT